MRHLPLFLMLISAPIFSAPLQSAKDTKVHCQKMTAALSAGNVDRAAELLQKHSNMAPEEVSGIKHSMRQIFSVEDPKYGKSLGAEFIKSEHAGDSMAVHFFLIRYENLPYGFLCTYYRGSAAWHLIGLTSEDEQFKSFMGR